MSEILRVRVRSGATSAVSLSVRPHAVDGRTYPMCAAHRAAFARLRALRSSRKRRSRMRSVFVVSLAWIFTHKGLG